jgi:hypothetical protein
LQSVLFRHGYMVACAVRLVPIGSPENYLRTNNLKSAEFFTFFLRV